MPRMIIVDAHEDLAYNAAILGRDYSRSVYETRRLESGTAIVEQRDNTLLGWPEYQKGHVAIVFSTLFAIPVAHATDISRKASYSNAGEASERCISQIEYYQRLADSRPEHFTMIRCAGDLARHLSTWRDSGDGSTHPVGLVILMEGADCISDPEELAAWWALGLRMIGPAWLGTRYCGGTGEPGPLTGSGRDLLKAMAPFNYLLDLSHMDEEAAIESLGFYQGPVMASHSNCAALLPGNSSNRHLSDTVIRGIISHGGVIGVVPCNSFLRVGWKKADSRNGIPLDLLVDHIDHICQLAGNTHHAGIGTDFDGGFGLESIPTGVDSIADLQGLSIPLAARGYSTMDVEAILGGNFIQLLERSLPAF